MTVRRATLIIPSRGLDDFPSHLTGDRAAELLAGWTALWHPALIDAIAAVPGWRSSDDLPDPSQIESELLLVPEASRLRMSADWADRLRATNPTNPPVVEVSHSRAETLAAVLETAHIDAGHLNPELVGDFFALGQAHLQVELLTQAMRYTTVLDTDHFSEATLAAAKAAVAGNEHDAREELARAFDLLADARSHVYSVDFYVVDVTLLAPSTLGENLRHKLAQGHPTSILASGELLERIAEEHPATLDELRRAIEAGTTSIVGGTYHNRFSEFACSESWLAEINLAQAAARRHLEREYKVFGQFHNAFSPVLPDVLQGTGFEGALHATFDGGRLPRTEQCKTWWGPEGQAIPALAATPLDASLPETWLKFAERIGDTIAHDHVATLLLASWPGQESEFFEDFRRASRYGPVLGKAVTLEEYFRVTREADDWTRFHTREYPSGPGKEVGPNPISSQVGAYRRAVSEIHEQLASGLAAAADLQIATSPVDTRQHLAVLNAWNFVCTKLTQLEPLRFPTAGEETISPGVPANSESLPRCLPDVPGCGFATFAAAAPVASVPLAEGRTLRNELLEVTVSESTGGIQSVRAHRDRSTRVSQRLVFQQGRSASLHDTQMIAEKITVTRNDALVGEIESKGRLLDASDGHLAQFRQRVRMVRGMPGVFVDVQLEPQQLPEGDLWRSYYASRLAFTDEAVSVRRGAHWLAFDTTREWIESPEWVEINDGSGTVACLGLGLPYHRRATPNWLDTLLLSAGEEARQFQFAISLDQTYLTQLSLGLSTAGPAPLAALPAQPGSSRGWFLHVAAKNVVVTHIEPIASSTQEVSSHDSTASAPPAPNGLRIRLLETEGRAARTQLSAFRAFTCARTTDLRGNSTGVLSTTDGNVDFDIGAHRWIQIEAEW